MSAKGDFGPHSTYTLLMWTFYALEACPPYIRPHKGPGHMSVENSRQGQRSLPSAVAVRLIRQQTALSMMTYQSGGS